MGCMCWDCQTGLARSHVTAPPTSPQRPCLPAALSNSSQQLGSPAAPPTPPATVPTTAVASALPHPRSAPAALRAPAPSPPTPGTPATPHGARRRGRPSLPCLAARMAGGCRRRKGSQMWGIERGTGCHPGMWGGPTAGQGSRQRSWGEWDRSRWHVSKALPMPRTCFDETTGSRQEA